MSVVSHLTNKMRAMRETRQVDAMENFDDVPSAFLYVVGVAH